MLERSFGSNDGFSRLKKWGRNTLVVGLIYSLLPVAPLPVAEVVDLGDVQIPLNYIADCSLDPPPGVVVYCSGFPTTDEKRWWEVQGQPVFMAHNTTYAKPGDNPPRGRLNPGAEIMNHIGQCVSFGKGWKFRIGNPEKKSRAIAWLTDGFPRLITSAGVAKEIPPGEPGKDAVMVYEVPLTPCENLDTLTTRRDVTRYGVKTGDTLSKNREVWGGAQTVNRR